MAYEIGYNPDIAADYIVGDYYVGDEYELGQEDEIEAVLGATRRRMLPGRGAVAPAARMMQPHRGLWGGGATVVKERRPTKDREWAIGFDSGVNIAAGASATITQRPQVLFRPERLVVPSAIGGSFRIDDIKVGNKSQTIASGGIPAATFAENSFGVRMLLDTVAVAMDLVLIVTNTSAAPARFTAAFVGKAVD